MDFRYTDYMKRCLLVSILIICFIGSILTGCSDSRSDDYDHTLPQVGDYVVFGKYEQDGNKLNGAESIEWEVLEVDGNRALLISRYVLDCQRYNEYTGTKAVTWETSDLRRWLNKDFYKTAFSESERRRIPTVTIENPDGPSYQHTDGGNDTDDKVFILSYYEVQNYYEFVSWHDDETYGYSQDLISDATPYAVSRGVHVQEISEYWYEERLGSEGYTHECIGQRGAEIWTRTPGLSGCYVCTISSDGAMSGEMGCRVEDTIFGVRPVIYLEY